MKRSLSISTLILTVIVIYKQAPEVSPEITSEPEGTSAPEVSPEVTSEPEGTSAPEVSPEVTSEPEGTSAPEVSPEVTLELEGTSAPEVSPEVTSEPEVTSAPEVSPEVTSEPEGTSAPEVSPEVTSEPEGTSAPEVSPEVTSEPEGTSVPEVSPEVSSEPEGTSAPEVSPEVTSEPEGTSVPEVSPEVTSEPEGTSAPEVSPEVKSEPEGTSAPEVSPEVTSEPEGTSVPEVSPEVTSEPEGTSAPEVSPEVTTEPEGTSAPEVSPEITSEPESNGAVSELSAEHEPTAEPNALEILLPPFILILVVLLAMICLYVYSNCSKPAEVMTSKGRRESNPNVIRLEEYNDSCKEDDQPFLSTFDSEVIACFQSHKNRPIDLIKIAMPALLSLALCPLTLYMYKPFTTFVWPKDQFSSAPDINDAISCFLAPAGLVYATSFGFAFQQALSKQSHILDKVTKEISMIDQIATFCSRINFPRPILRRRVYRCVKSEIIFMILQILNRTQNSFHEKPVENVKIKIWSVIDTLREVNTDVNDNKTQVDRVLCEKIVDHIMQLNSICSDRLSVLHTKIHPVKWAFLETLGFFSFVGILLLKAFSYRMELVMCIITVFSISMLCYVVSDLDSPFSGFFRVDISVLIDVVRRIENLHTESKKEELRCRTETSSEVDSMFDPGTPDLQETSSTL